jgi:hypothetical protein
MSRFRRRIPCSKRYFQGSRSRLELRFRRIFQSLLLCLLSARRGCRNRIGHNDLHPAGSTNWPTIGNKSSFSRCLGLGQHSPQSAIGPLPQMSDVKTLPSLNGAETARPSQTTVCPFGEGASPTEDISNSSILLMMDSIGTCLLPPCFPCVVPSPIARPAFWHSSSIPST